MSQSDAPRPLAILGRASAAAHIALRRVLRAKEPDRALVVFDYQGAAAAALDESNRGSLYRAPLLWCDLGNRRKPAAVFRLQRSPGLAQALKAFLAQTSHLCAAPLSEDTIAWAVKLASELADRGSVGLAALLRALRRPEILQWFRRQHGPDGEIERLIALLVYQLQFPAVWSGSEGNNRLDLRRVLERRGTIWFELPAQHMEKAEHEIVARMAEASIVDLLVSGNSEVSTMQKPPLVLYAFPPAPPLPFLDRHVVAKHIGVFGFSAERRLPMSAAPWLEGQADRWIVGGVGRIAAGWSERWWSAQELERIRALRPGELWARAGADGKAVTMRVRTPEPPVVLARHHRHHALKGRVATRIAHLSRAVAFADGDARDTDLYKALCRRENLLRAWMRVKARSAKSHGSDGVTMQLFGAHAERELTRLADDLESGRYRCRPMRTVRIPKGDGGERALKIACVRDQVAQTACLELLEPVFEPRFSRFSYAYRPNRSAHHAVAFARALIRGGKAWAVTADIRSCFDTIDREILLRLLAADIDDSSLLRLLRHWLYVDALDFQDLIPSELGVPQGSALSPLLANVYLDPLDKEFERNGIDFARYADDYLVLCKTQEEAAAALRLMEDFLRAVLRLTLKPAKTQYRAVAQGVGFLGFVLGDPHVYVHSEKLDQTTRAVRDDVRRLASPQATLFERSAALQHMNALIRGFRNYFLIDDAPHICEQLRAVDAEIDRAASELLPIALRHELAWLARERLAPVSESDTPQAATLPGVAAVTSFYPDYSAPAVLGCRTDNGRQAAEGKAGHSENEAAPHAATLDATVDEVEEARGGTLIDGRLYVMTGGAYVTVQGDELVVRRRREELRRVALDKLAMLLLQGSGVGISVELMLRLSERDVPVVFAPAVGRPAAMAAALQGGKSKLRQQQILRRNEPEVVHAGIAMLAAKVGNQASVLKYFARYRKKNADRALHDALSCAAREIRTLAEMIRGLDSSAAGLRSAAMGYEGRAAALYWAAVAQLVPPDLAFPGRHTRQAADVFNQAVNYVYGVLYSEVWKAVVHAGLDPYSGIMHGTDRDQGSLVFDLIEEFRAPFGERLVIGMLGRGFRPALGRDGQLRGAARRLLVRAFHRMWSRSVRWRGKSLSPARILEQQARALGRAFLGEETYRPFQFRW